MFNFACQLMQFSHAFALQPQTSSQSGAMDQSMLHAGHHKNMTAHGLPEMSAESVAVAMQSHCMPSADGETSSVASHDCCQSGSLCNQSANTLTLLSMDAPTPIVALLPVELLIPQSDNLCLPAYQQTDTDFALTRPRVHLVNCTLLN